MELRDYYMKQNENLVCQNKYNLWKNNLVRDHKINDTSPSWWIYKRSGELRYQNAPDEVTNDDSEDGFITDFSM